MAIDLHAPGEIACGDGVDFASESLQWLNQPTRQTVPSHRRHDERHEKHDVQPRQFEHLAEQRALRNRDGHHPARRAFGQGTRRKLDRSMGPDHAGCELMPC
jgi:hypothetical protein